MALTSVADGVFAERHGDGPPAVVALHGWARRGSDFDAALTGLDALAVDLPGFGASVPPGEPVGARGYATLLEPVLTALDRPTVLVGHSFGGRVAVVLAARLPIAGLLLTGVPLVRIGTQRRPPIGFRALRWANARRIVSDDRMERERRRRGSADYRAAEGVMRGVLVASVSESYEDELSGVSAPTRLLWGADDTEVPPEVAHRAATLLGSGDVAVDVLEGVGHFLPLEAPAALRSVIDRMLGAS